MGAICRRVKLTVARKRICPLKVIIHQTDLPILSRNCQNGSKRAVVTTSTSVKKKVPLSSGVTCQPSALDLSKHNSFFSENMTPELYNKLKDKKTKLGVTLGHCIKTGVDNPGHPMIKTCGIVAGDEESYELFKELFDPIISARHGGYAPDAKHPTDLDVNKLSDTEINPTGKYVLTSQCRTGRSVRGFRLPPTCSFEERREIEKVVVNGH